MLHAKRQELYQPRYEQHGLVTIRHRYVATDYPAQSLASGERQE